VKVEVRDLAIADDEANVGPFHLDITCVHSALEQGEELRPEGELIDREGRSRIVGGLDLEVVDDDGQGPRPDGRLEGSFEAGFLMEEGSGLIGGPGSGHLGSQQDASDDGKQPDEGEEDAQNASNPSTDADGATPAHHVRPRLACRTRSFDLTEGSVQRWVVMRERTSKSTRASC
jgi:hypothetical protein